MAGFRAPGAGARALIPYTGEQGAGAFLAMALLCLWGARGHLRDVVRKALGRAPEISDADEPLSYRAAVVGLALSLVGLIAFLVAGGMAWSMAAGFFALYLLTVVAITRLRAEAGPMLAYGPDLNPQRMMALLPGTERWAPRDLTALAYLHWFSADTRTVAMPAQMEAMRLAEGAALPARTLTRWLLPASLLAVLASFVTVLAIYYHYGAVTPRGDNPWRLYNGLAPFTQLKDWLTNPTQADTARLQWMGVGFAITAALMRARAQLVWWPFHPAGFLMAHAGMTMGWVWFPTLMGWLAKALVLRYGGMRLFQRGIPFFLGLVLGDIVAACGWSILGVLLDAQMYMFFPG